MKGAWWLDETEVRSVHLKFSTSRREGVGGKRNDIIARTPARKVRHQITKVTDGEAWTCALFCSMEEFWRRPRACPIRSKPAKLRLSAFGLGVASDSDEKASGVQSITRSLLRTLGT